MKEESTMTGQCLCGAVKFVATEVDETYHACHCAMCRRWGGAPFFGVHVGGVTFDGEENITRYTSSEWAERGFCAKCGSNLFYHMKRANTYSLCAGLFDDQSRHTLDNEIFIDEKPDGYELGGDLPKMTGAEAIAKYMSNN